MIKCVVWFLISFFSWSPAKAAIHASIGVFPDIRTFKKTAETSATQVSADIYLGYVFPSQWTLGVLFGSHSEQTTQTGFSNPTDNQTIARQRSSYGISFGYDFETFYTRMTGMVFSEWHDNFGGVETIYKRATGLQLDIGIRISLGSSVYFAPQLTYQNFIYTQSYAQGSNSDLNPVMSDSGLSPYLVLGLVL